MCCAIANSRLRSHCLLIFVSKLVAANGVYLRCGHACRQRLNYDFSLLSRIAFLCVRSVGNVRLLENNGSWLFLAQ